MVKIKNYDFYSSRFMDLYLSGKVAKSANTSEYSAEDFSISFSFMMNLLSLPVL